MSIYDGDFKKRIMQKYGAETAEEEQPQKQDLGDFQRLLDAMTSDPDKSMWAWVEADADVAKANSIMRDVFFDTYLFTSLQAGFVQFCKVHNIDVIKNYVDTTLAKTKEYVSPLDKYEDERKQLHNEIAELRKQNETLAKNQKDREVIKV